MLLNKSILGLVGLLLASTSLTGCSSYQLFPSSLFNNGGFMRSPRAEVHHYRPVPVVVPAKRLTEADIKPSTAKSSHNKSSKKTPKSRKGNPIKTIQAANRKARHFPDSSDYENATMRYTFEKGALYKVYAAPLRLTDIQLQPGERITGKPAAGDTERWVLGVNDSIENGQAQQHLLIKPTQANLKTTLIINTNRRTYLLELSSHKKTWMAAVRWQYPDETQHTQQHDAYQHLAAPDIDLDKLNFAYSIRGPHRRPVWTPTRVFDDGRRVFIRFPKARKYHEAPALFVVSTQGETQLVNYRVQNDYYIVDRLFNRAELRVGQGKANTIRILREG